MELLLIRHALPLRVEADEGRADPSLSDEGRRQAKLLAAWLERERLDAVYSSPLRRARETAVPLAEAIGVPIVVIDELAEWDRDSSMYIPLEELKASGHPAWEAMARGDWSALGIDPVAFAQRVITAIDGIAREHPGARVAVVCHGGVINAYTAAVAGVDRLLWFSPGYTSVSRVLVARSGTRSIQSINEMAHLRE